MPIIGNLAVTLSLNTIQFTRELAKTAGLTAALAGDIDRSLRIIQRSWDKASRAVQTFGVFLAGATAAVSGIGIMAVKHAAEFEQAQVAFTTMLGSAQEAERFLSDLRRFAARTPFEFKGLQQSARQLLAFGFTADQVLQMLTPIGDAVSALGGSTEVMDRVIRAIGQIRTKGRVQAEEMLQLTEAGINAWQYLARELGTSTAEAVEMVRRGQVDAATGIRALLKGMQRDFGGGMAAQSRTIMGTWSNLKDNLNILLTSLGQTISEAFRVPETLQRLVQWLDRAAESVENFRKTLKESGIREALDQLASPKLQFGVVMLAGAIAGLLIPVLIAQAHAAWLAVAPLLPYAAIAAVVAGAAYLIWRAWGSVAKSFVPTLRSMGATALEWAATVARAVASVLAVLGTFTPYLRVVATGVQALADKLAAWARALTQPRIGMGDLKAIEAADSAMKSTGKTAEQATKAQEGLGDALKDVAKQAENNIQSFDEVHQIQESIASSADKVGKGLDTAITLPDLPTVPAADILDIKLPDLPSLLDDFNRLGGSLGSLGGVLQVFATNWVTAMQKAIQAGKEMGERLREQLGTLGEDFDRITQRIRLTAENWGVVLRQRAGGALDGVPEQWRNRLQEMLDAVMQMWQRLPEIAAQPLANLRTTVSTAWADLRTNAVTVWSQIQADLSTRWQTIVTQAQGAWSGLSTWLGTTWQTLRTNAGLTFGGLWTDLSNRWANISQSTSQWWGGIRDWLGQTWTGIRLGAGPVFMGLWSDISSIWGNTHQDTTQRWNGIQSTLTGIWQGMGQDADTQFGGIRSIIASNWNLAMIDTSTAWGNIDVDLAQWWDGIKQRAATTWPAVVQEISSRWATIKSETATTWADISSSLRSTWQGILDTATAKWNGVKETIRGAINGIIGIINSFIRAFNRIEIRVPKVEIPLVGTVGGWSIRVPQIPEIPRLAEGGIVTAPTLAMIGEGGRREAVVPLERDNVLADSIAQAVYAAVRDAIRFSTVGRGEQPQATEVVLQIDGYRIGRVIMPALIRESQRTGTRLILRPSEA